MLCICISIRSHLQLLLENAMTLPRHSDRNSSVAESVGQYSEISWSL